MDAAGIAFDGVADALAMSGVDIRLFGKPEAFARRRMGVALATAASTDEARSLAKAAAATVKPVKV
jgi:phosphoribosylglycinamide formyltransferase 2